MFSSRSAEDPAQACAGCFRLLQVIGRLTERGCRDLRIARRRLLKSAASPLESVAAALRTGGQITFATAACADFLNEVAQAGLTEHVWLIRGNAQGLHSAARESTYNQLFPTAPKGTRRATDTLADFDALEFTDWST